MITSLFPLPVLAGLIVLFFAFVVFPIVMFFDSCHDSTGLTRARRSALRAEDKHLDQLQRERDERRMREYEVERIRYHRRIVEDQETLARLDADPKLKAMQPNVYRNARERLERAGILPIEQPTITH